MIFSVGYGNRKPSEFLELLQKHKIRMIIDVRAYRKAWTKMYSAPRFSKWLEENEVKYTWAHMLGNKDRVHPDNFELDDKQKKYLKCVGPLSRVAIMCAETKTDSCHRKKFVEYLRSLGYEVEEI